MKTSPEQPPLMDLRATVGRLWSETVEAWKGKMALSLTPYQTLDWLSAWY